MSITFSPARMFQDDGRTCVEHLYDGPYLNVSETNAKLIFERLGLTPEPYGEVDPKDILGRAMVANVGRDDTGVRPSVDGNWTDCGLRAGYFADKMAGLIEVATWAADRGFVVVWS